MGVARAIIVALSYPVGAFIALMGFLQIGMASSPTGFVAGGLMATAGLVLFPHGRLVLQTIFGRRITSGDVATIFLTCFLAAAGLNIVFP